MTDLRARIDALMDDQKALAQADTPEWQALPYQGCERWIGHLQGSDGATLEVRLVLDNYQSFGTDKFILQLIHYGVTTYPVMRLCFGADVRHRNRPSPGNPIPSDIDAGWIYGPHMHLWRDNRHLGTARALPEELRFARKWDENIKSFQAGFWAFCAEANITCGQHQIPMSLPTGRLF